MNHTTKIENSDDVSNIVGELMATVGKVEQGEVNALDVYPVFYELEKSVKELTDQLKDFVIEELDKFDKKETVIRGDYQLSTRTMTRHSYSHDEHWTSVKQSLSNREAQMKKAYAMSQKGQVLTDLETGEAIPPSEAKTSTSVVAKFVGGITL